MKREIGFGPAMNRGSVILAGPSLFVVAATAIKRRTAHAAESGPVGIFPTIRPRSVSSLLPLRGVEQLGQRDLLEHQWAWLPL